MAKPIILSVDDDPEVLAAIDRDLRQHYKSDYRIVRASSAKIGLDTAQQIKQRGNSIALFLVDQRMPEMTGTDFLKQVCKLHPDSRKVLLTAYADTEAAISSINDIGLDHYLMKPWDPPEQKLYPVLDDLLTEWKMRVRLPYDGIRIAGAQWSANSYNVKEFLSRNQVPYQWIDIDQDEPTRELVLSLTGDTNKLPVVFLSDGSYLVQPTQNEIAEKVGLQTRAKLPFYDLVIIGGGPAGLAVAVYGGSEGLRTLLLEQNAPGGQAGTSSRIENYLGFPSGVTGADLTNRAVAQAKKFGAEIVTSQNVVGIRREDPYRYVQLEDGSEVAAYSVVIATGMSVRTLEAGGIESLLGIGVYYGAAMTEAAGCRDKEICIVGGANSAGQGAMFFSKYAKKVTVLIRANELGIAMSRYLVDRIKITPNIEVICRVEVVEVAGNRKVEKITLKNIDTDEVTEISSSAMFIFIGTKPHSEMFDGILEKDENGFILTGSDLPKLNGRPKGWNLDRDPFIFETNIPGVFAVGDVRSGANRRVAMAVGEGSASVYLVHKYLESV